MICLSHFHFLSNKKKKIFLLFTSQNLLYNQGSLGLIKVEKGDLNLDPKNFDPKKTVLTMMLKAAQTESVLWHPCEDDDTLWIKEKGYFHKVLFCAPITTQF